MNYISHLNEVFRKFYEDDKLNALDISMYMGLFQTWNIYRFPKEFHVNREEQMKLAKIGSYASYHRCLRKLHKFKYIIYIPSHSIYRGSKVRILKFDTTDDTTPNTINDTIPHTTGITSIEQLLTQPLVSNINNNKPIENNNKRGAPANYLEVLNFFESKNWPQREAQKFFNYYESLDWKKHGQDPIRNWTALAENWIIKADEMKKTGQKFYSKNRDTESYLNVQK
ncbi:MAG: hypothetical protein WA951_12270 [Leeuwenhoekiella sp.]